MGTFPEVSVPVKQSSVFQPPFWPNDLVLCRDKQVKPCSLHFLPLEMMLLSTPPSLLCGWKPLGFLGVSFEAAGVLGMRQLVRVVDH